MYFKGLVDLNKGYLQSLNNAIGIKAKVLPLKHR